MIRLAVVLCLFYLGAGMATGAFLFHLPVGIRSLDPTAERLRIARSIPTLDRLRSLEDGERLASRAVALGIVLLWPLFVAPLLRWLLEIREGG